MVSFYITILLHAIKDFKEYNSKTLQRLSKGFYYSDEFTKEK